MPKRKCSQCGASFTVPFPSSKRKSCSYRCREKLRHGKRKTRADKGVRKGKWITVSCEKCGKDFERKPGYVNRQQKRGWRIYCSPECRDANAGTYSGRPLGRGGKGARWVDDEGYVRVYVAPSDRPAGWRKSSMLEHRVVMTQTLGRQLLPNETIHHIDGDKTNNAPENLQLRSGRHGKGSHFRCRACGSTDIEAVSFKES